MNEQQLIKFINKLSKSEDEEDKKLFEEYKQGWKKIAEKYKKKERD